MGIYNENIDDDGFTEEKGHLIMIESMLSDEWRKTYTNGWYLAHVKKEEKSEYLVPELLYYGPYEYKAPEGRDEEEIKENLRGGEFLHRGLVMGIGFHKELKICSGCDKKDIMVYHLDNPIELEEFPKIIKLEKLDGAYDTKKIDPARTLVRSYAEAVDVAVNFWIEKTFYTETHIEDLDLSSYPPTDQYLKIMRTCFKQMALKNITSESIERFRSCLRHKLLNVYNSGEKRGICTVLFGTNEILLEVCEESGVSPHCLPDKTTTFIREDNRVIVLLYQNTPDRVISL
ncbi:hypothetical protein [Leptospira levettii]|uniref:hypothetical protein n=1 Tax=Leptospira levettii TaxID=2023178 RepID=UPI000C298642|nr:hypothetical protein [Leptospira levettii]PJZ89534.1 hypothetical protein CH368_06135 [Leptospira levettii]